MELMKKQWKKLLKNIIRVKDEEIRKIRIERYDLFNWKKKRMKLN